MIQFSVRDAKTHLSKLIDAALAGEDAVITRGGVPVVRLVPTRPVGRRQFGALKGKIALDPRFDEPLDAEEAELWSLG